MAWIPFEDSLCQGYNFRCNRVCPRIAKSELRGSFLSSEFRWRFNGGAKWITQLAGMFPVRVVNAPELTARLRSHVCAHARSSPQARIAKMYQLHKMRGQSVWCPVGDHCRGNGTEQLLIQMSRSGLALNSTLTNYLAKMPNFAARNTAKSPKTFHSSPISFRHAILWPPFARFRLRTFVASLSALCAAVRRPSSSRLASPDDRCHSVRMAA